MRILIVDDDYIVKPLMEYHFLGRLARFAKGQKKQP